MAIYAGYTEVSARFTTQGRQRVSPMIYNVAQLLKAPVGTTQRVELDDADELKLEDNEAQLAGPVTGHVRMHRTNQGIFVDGEAQVPIELEPAGFSKASRDPHHGEGRP